MTDSEILAFGKRVIEVEAHGILSSMEGQSDSFVAICREIAACPGKIILTGVGKAGLIGKKISATMASTGTPSLWLDPTNALHGDLGMVTSSDIAILISNSGSSGELLLTAKGLRTLGVRLTAMTRSENTLLAKLCDRTLPLGEHDEACPLKLAPSTSTSVMLALGDAVALTVQKLKDFTESDYARYHPAGALGRQVVPVEQMMRTGQKVAIVRESSALGDAIQAITRARCGLCIVVDERNVLQGVYSDGDFRRDWSAGVNFTRELIRDHMNRTPRAVERLVSGGEALAMMHDLRVNALPVLDADRVVVGLVDIQDLV